jgi:hypothetical protein
VGSHGSESVREETSWATHGGECVREESWWAHGSECLREESWWAHTGVRV